MANDIAERELCGEDDKKLSILFKFYQEAIKYSIKEVNTLQEESKTTDNLSLNDLKEELEVKEKALEKFEEFVKNAYRDLDDSEDKSGEFIESSKRIEEDYTAEHEHTIDNNLGVEIKKVQKLLYAAEDSVNRLERATKEPIIEESSVSESKTFTSEEKLRVLVVYQPKIRSEDSVVTKKPDIEVKDMSIQTLYFMYPPNCFTVDYARHMAYGEGKICHKELAAGKGKINCSTQTYETAVKYKYRTKNSIIRLSAPEIVDELVMEERKVSFVSPRADTLISNVHSSMSELTIPKPNKNWKDIDTRTIRQLVKRKIKDLGFRKELESMSQREIEEVAKAIGTNQTSQGNSLYATIVMLNSKVVQLMQDE